MQQIRLVKCYIPPPRKVSPPAELRDQDYKAGVAHALRAGQVAGKVLDQMMYSYGFDPK